MNELLDLSIDDEARRLISRPNAFGSRFIRQQRPPSNINQIKGWCNNEDKPRTVSFYNIHKLIEEQKKSQLVTPPPNSQSFLEKTRNRGLVMKSSLNLKSFQASSNTESPPASIEQSRVVSVAKQNSSKVFHIPLKAIQRPDAFSMNLELQSKLMMDKVKTPFKIASPSPQKAASFSSFRKPPVLIPLTVMKPQETQRSHLHKSLSKMSREESCFSRKRIMIKKKFIKHYYMKSFADPSVKFLHKAHVPEKQVTRKSNSQREVSFSLEVKTFRALSRSFKKTSLINNN